jgi:Domain of unknown function (DUF4150)/Novel toxin 16
MPITVKVNGAANSLVHKGSNGISIATIPDVCKTPSPAGPVPVPYPNISQSATLDKGTTTVKADGGMMIANKGSEFSLSNGDNPGVAGGVKSSTFMKESTWILYSFDVKMDGKNACRLTDKKFQNHENTADLAGTMLIPTAVPPGQIPESPGDCTQERHDALSRKVNKTKDQVALRGGACEVGDSKEKLRAKGKAWQEQVDARTARENECYRGGNDGHKQAIANAEEHVKRCKYILRTGKPPRWDFPT